MRKRGEQQFPDLYHGTAHGFAVGDKINPSPDWIYEGADKVYLSDNLPQVGWYASDRAGLGTIGKIGQPQQLGLFGSVYKVDAKDPQVAGNKIPGHYTTEHPAEITEHVGFVSHEGEWLSGPEEGKPVLGKVPPKPPSTQRLADARQRRQDRMKDL